jgi:hypothetical protein
MHGSMSPRLTHALVATGTLLLGACADAPSAPRAADQVTTSGIAARPSAPSALSAAALATELGVPGAHRSAGVAADPGIRASAAVASVASLQVGARGMLCNQGPGLQIRVPRPQGTANLVQSFETAWWYPMVYRWDGRQWVHHGNVGWTSTRLPAAEPKWVLHETGASLQNVVSAHVPDGYYAVLSHVYFDGSRQWASQWEGAYEYQNPTSERALNRVWCEVASPPRG